MTEEKQRPKVGVGAMILNQGRVLLGKRHTDPNKADSDLHGEGTWTMPGGKLEFQETLIDGVYRETLEEAGIKINKDNLRVISVADDIVHDNHYVTIGFLCEDFEGEVEVMEPDEITEWKWYDINELPEKIFISSAKIIKAYLNQKIYI
jgi:ADP-ribose pyrophosphatase YjhB (NUDIX family)